MIIAVRTRGLESEEDEAIDPKEWNYFIRSVPTLKDEELEDKPPSQEWLTERAWRMLSEMDKRFDLFKGITRSIRLSGTEWERYYKDPENKEVPVD